MAGGSGGTVSTPDLLGGDIGFGARPSGAYNAPVILLSVKIFNTVLSDAEVLSYYTSGGPA